LVQLALKVIYLLVYSCCNKLRWPLKMHNLKIIIIIIIIIQHLYSALKSRKGYRGADGPDNFRNIYTLGFFSAVVSFPTFFITSFN